MQIRTVGERRLGISRKLLSRLKQTEQGITLNGRRAYTTEKVTAGDVLHFRMELEISEDILPQPMALDILYEDDALLFVNKPAGLIVHPTHGHYTGTLANGVVQHWRERGEQVRFRPVHRLDQETSGVVAIAKTPYIHQQLSEQMQAGQIGKHYVAFAFGVPAVPAGVVDAPIDRNPLDPHYRIVTPDGYPSVTHYEVQANYRGMASKLVLQLETGRTHQIRVHMQSIGCPLIGDKMYRGTNETLANRLATLEDAVGRHALHAARLALVHPLTGQQLVIEAPLPAELQQLEQQLEGL